MQFYLENVIVEPEDHTECRELLQKAKNDLEWIDEQKRYGDAVTVDYGKVLHRLGERELAFKVLNACIYQCEKEDGNKSTQIRAHECLGRCYEADADIGSAIDQYNKAKTKNEAGGHNFTGKFYEQRLKVLCPLREKILNDLGLKYF